MVEVAVGALCVSVGVEVGGTAVGPVVTVRVGKRVIAIVGTGELVGDGTTVVVSVGVTDGPMVAAGTAVGKETTRVFSGGEAVGFRRIASVDAGLSIEDVVAVGLGFGVDVDVDFGRRITRAVAVGSIGVSVASTSTLITAVSIDDDV